MNQKRPVNMTRWLLIGGALLLLLMLAVPSGPAAAKIEISQIIQMAQDSRIEKITVKGDKLTVKAMSLFYDYVSS